MGFYLRMPQSFCAVAKEACHLHTLDREGMATMQVCIDSISYIIFDSSHKVCM